MDTAWCSWPDIGSVLTCPAPSPVTKEEVSEHFATHGTGEIKEIKLMNGFGFIEYSDAMDAQDVVPGKCYHLITPLFNLLITDKAQLSVSEKSTSPARCVEAHNNHRWY